MTDATFAATLPPSPLPVSRPVEAASPVQLDVRFTGSGSEYFRIWIVNLLLTLVTLGLYAPWAKVRTLRYMYGNTSVGGHALDFHGNPKRMLRGYLLSAALVGVYAIAGQVSPEAGLVAIGAWAAVWPALFMASMRFRLASTSWRGLRFRFTGDLKGAYGALLPLLAPALVVLSAGLLEQERSRTMAALLGFAMLLTVAFLPWAWWRLKRYQHGHFTLGSQHARLDIGPGAFYGVFLKAGGIALLGLVLIGVAIGLFSWGGKELNAPAVVGIVSIGFVGAIMFQLLPKAFVVSRLQNVLWSGTRSADVRFQSRLRIQPLVWLTLRNAGLMSATVGLYWPFAVVAMRRMKLEAVTVRSRRDPAALIGGPRQVSPDAVGEAADDLLGIDFGL
jgi:uncharacterized membrane protein YjgN (DUF898 family)